MLPPRRSSLSHPPMAHQTNGLQQILSMKLIQLRYLVAVAENDLNITQAARSLHAAQPGVSKQLKQLEDELGFALFERKGRALLRPTDAGNKVIDRAAQIVRQAR